LKEELKDKLRENYPALFENITYISCGDGWYSLLDLLGSKITNYVNFKRDHQNIELSVKAMQIKEKFGGLRFYVSGSDPYINGMISFAENYSYKVCTVCGNPSSEQKERGWIYTMCEPCQKQKLKKEVYSC